MEVLLSGLFVYLFVCLEDLPNTVGWIFPKEIQKIGIGPAWDLLNYERSGAYADQKKIIWMFPFIYLFCALADVSAHLSFLFFKFLPVWSSQPINHVEKNFT